MDEQTAYAVAAEAITEGDVHRYQAIRAEYPGLDWNGHDRRVALAQGKTIEDLGVDPIWRRMDVGEATIKRALSRDNE